MIGNDPPTAVSTLVQRVISLQQAYPSNPMMIGEAGWPTAGVDANYSDPTAHASLAGAEQYYTNLYPYLMSCNVPTLVSEAYDQPTKGLGRTTPEEAPAIFGQLRWLRKQGRRREGGDSTSLDRRCVLEVAAARQALEGLVRLRGPL